MKRQFCGRISLIFGTMAVSAVLGSAQSLWVGAATAPTTFNFSPTFFSGELTNLGSSPTSLAFYSHTNGDTGLPQWDLILGFANGGPATAPTITSVTAFSNVGNADGNNNITASGGTTSSVAINPSQTATFTSADQDSYTALGLPNGQGSPSENFGNWTGAEASVGISASKFTLYLYSLNSFASYMGDYGLLDITFNTALPQGTFGVGYACAQANGCGSNRNRDNSVFTQTGFAGGGGSTPVPEPSSLILLGTVFLAILGIWQRKSKRSFVA